MVTKNKIDCEVICKDLLHKERNNKNKFLIIFLIF